MLNKLPLNPFVRCSGRVYTLAIVHVVKMCKQKHPTKTGSNF